MCGVFLHFFSVYCKVMSVLRENRDSVMAMLEAFVYDPLISWRLLAGDGTAENTAVPIASGASGGNLRSAASNEDDTGTSKSSVEQLRVQIAAGSLLGGPGAPADRNQSMRNQSMRDMKGPNIGGAALLGEDGEPLQENLNARYELYSSSFLLLVSIGVMFH